MNRQVVETDPSGKPTVIVYRLDDTERDTERAEARQQAERALEVAGSLTKPSP